MGINIMDETNREWDYLRDMCDTSEETLQIVTDINGMNTRTLHDVLYAKTGENSFPWENED